MASASESAPAAVETTRTVLSRAGGTRPDPSSVGVDRAAGAPTATLSRRRPTPTTPMASRSAPMPRPTLGTGRALGYCSSAALLRCPPDAASSCATSPESRRAWHRCRSGASGSSWQIVLANYRIDSSSRRGRPSWTPAARALHRPGRRAAKTGQPVSSCLSIPPTPRSPGNRPQLPGWGPAGPVGPGGTAAGPQRRSRLRTTARSASPLRSRSRLCVTLLLGGGELALRATARGPPQRCGHRRVDRWIRSDAPPTLGGGRASGAAVQRPFFAARRTLRPRGRRRRGQGGRRR